MSRKKRKPYNLVAIERDPKPEKRAPGASVTVRVGDIVIRTPVIGLFGEKESGPMLCRVVYVHPKNRFHIVQFGEGERAVKESFIGVEYGQQEN